jgi:H/ACA ribonucleoprotein complex subunit 4
MKELRRIKAGRFSEHDAHKIQDVVAAYDLWKNGDEIKLREMIVSIEDAVAHLRKVVVKNSAIWSIAHGSPVYTSGIESSQETISKDDLVAVFSLQGKLIALGIANMKHSDMINKRGRAVKIDRVMIDVNNLQKDV